MISVIEINYVTGASSGIGKAVVINLIKSGYQVFRLARRYEQLIRLYSELPTDIKNANHYYLPIECDIAKLMTSKILLII
jgi:short-subunit dehydrogenase